MLTETLTSFTLMGAPRTKKNSQRIAKTKTGRRFVLPSKAFETYQKAALWQLKKAWGRPALRGNVAIEAHFYRDRATGDLNNYIQALADILEKGKVLENDRLVRSWDGSRLHTDRKQPRVVVIIRVFSAIPQPE